MTLIRHTHIFSAIPSLFNCKKSNLLNRFVNQRRKNQSFKTHSQPLMRVVLHKTLKQNHSTNQTIKTTQINIAKGNIENSTIHFEE